MQVQSFRRRRWRTRRLWLLAAGWLALLLVGFLTRPSGEPALPSAPVSGSPRAVPPWLLGNPDGRFTLTLYADLECPFCRSYFPLLKRWVSSNADVALQWHHLPLAAHEPAASAEARLAECAAESGGQTAFWQTIEWVYAHTRSNGQGLPDGLRYPGLTPAIEQCLASERPDAVIRAQAVESITGGVTATPSVRLQDRETGKAILLVGPIEGDALLSAMDMLATGDQPAAAEMPAGIASSLLK
ncbi:thioredoxin domain-containing protein [Burkholderia sola]